jgi:hypothetical protein
MAEAISSNRPQGSDACGDSVDEKGFREFVKKGERVPKNMPEETVRSNIRMVREFERFLRTERAKKGYDDAKERDVRAFIKHLAKDDRSTVDNLIGLLRYARFRDNRDAELALLVILDGSSILGILCDTVKSEHGEGVFEELLGDFTPPPIGTSFKRLPKATSEFMGRVESGLGERKTRALLLTGPHAGPPEAYAEERRMFEASKDVDDYLRRRREKFVGELRDHMEKGTLFFTQPIDRDALDFVEGNPEIAGGVRKGNWIYCTKVPYMIIDHLKEKDPKLRRYHYCHCPLARESILSGETMSRNLCYCSAGYEKRPFDVAFGKSVKAEVKQSVLWGDPVCRFAIEIPEEHRVKKA